jgi:putative addiction module killer protein
MKTVVVYNKPGGIEPINLWINALKDISARAKIRRRIERMEEGNYGSHRYLQGAIFELKIDYGPGYRVYCGEEGKKIVVLLCGGNKSSQNKDIKIALEYWVDYLKRK